MSHMLEGHRQELIELCRKYGVRRLDVFGSAARGDFDGQSSDVDLLVEFGDMPHADRADAFLGFLTAAEALLQRQDQSRAFWLSEQLILDRLGQSPSGQVWTPVDTWA